MIFAAKSGVSAVAHKAILFDSSLSGNALFGAVLPNPLKTFLRVPAKEGVDGIKKADFHFSKRPRRYLKELLTRSTTGLM
jgi:hypothetical protein